MRELLWSAFRFLVFLDYGVGNLMSYCAFLCFDNKFQIPLLQFKPHLARQRQGFLLKISVMPLGTGACCIDLVKTAFFLWVL